MNTRISRSAILFALIAIAEPASAGEPNCLGGDVASADLAAILAVEAAVDGACACETFDGSEDRQAADYRRCVLAVVKEAVLAEELRPKCKSRLAKAYKASTCGRSDDAAPCIETKSDGDVRCKVQTLDKCVDVPGRVTRVACSDAVRCIDAADDSGDWVVSSADSGTCRPPATTTTSTLAPETTTTLAPETTTTVVPETTTTFGNETTTTTLEEETTTTTLPCGLDAPTLVIRTYALDTRELVPDRPVFPPDPRADACDPQSLLGGGCGDSAYRLGLDGTIPYWFDASGSYVPNACPGTTLSFHWEFFRPPGLGATPYAASGITGYFLPEVSIRPNSLPDLEESEAAGDPNWRVLLTVTANQGASPVRAVWFKFGYSSSSLTLEESTLCQSQPEHCDPANVNGRRPTEPW